MPFESATSTVAETIATGVVSGFVAVPVMVTFQVLLTCSSGVAVYVTTAWGAPPGHMAALGAAAVWTGGIEVVGAEACPVWVVGGAWVPAGDGALDPPEELAEVGGLAGADELVGADGLADGLVAPDPPD